VGTNGEQRYALCSFGCVFQWCEIGFRPSQDTLFNMTESQTYKNDWIGLKTLDMSGRIDMMSYAGAHVQFTQEFWDNSILPYFDN
jgi:hypothetical protein